jgi:hypothetical protein
MALDYSRLTDAELDAIANNDYSSLSDQTLAQIAGEDMRPAQQQLTAPRAAQLLTRGAAPVLTGAGVGGALAGPPGMLAGGLVLPAADIVAKGLNVVLPENMQVQYPSVAASNLMQRLGMPAPQTTGERAIEAAGAGLAMPTSQLPALQTLSRTAATPAARGVATTLSQAPSAQIAASAPSAGVSQFVGEKTESPLLGSLAGMATSLPFGMFSKRTPVEKIPTRDELRKLASANYDVAKASTLAFKEQPYKQTVQSLKSTLIDEGFDPDLHPRVNTVLNRLETETKPKTIQQMETLRKVARNAAGSIDPDERRLGMKIIDSIDDFVENATPQQVNAQDKGAIESLKTARSLYSQNKKSEILDEIFDVAELRATANYSQSGMEQALRSRLVNLSANKKQMRAFNSSEQAAIRKAAKGGSIQNALRMLGKQAPVGGVSQITGPSIGAGIGAFIGGPTGAAVGAAAVPAASALARGQATRMGLQNFQDLQKMLLLGRLPMTTVPVSGALGARGALPGLLNQEIYLDRNARIDEEQQ